MFVVVCLCLCVCVSNLAEKPLAAPSCRRGVVDIDVMVLSTYWLLHKWLLENLPIYLNMVLSLNQVTFCHHAHKRIIST